MEPSPTSSFQESEQLLTEVNRSIFTRALLLSTVVHLALVFGTSFGLYRDWAEYGFHSEDKGIHSPSDIKSIKRELAKEREEQRREAEMEQRLAERRAQAAEELAKEDEAGSSAEATPTAAPVAPTLEPLPPKSGFDLDDLPGLDG